MTFRELEADPLVAHVDDASRNAIQRRLQARHEPRCVRQKAGVPAAADFDGGRTAFTCNGVDLRAAGRIVDVKIVSARRLGGGGTAGEHGESSESDAHGVSLNSTTLRRAA